MKYATKLDESFLTPYKTMAPPWGPIGYVTMKRTYPRKIDATCICPRQGCKAETHRVEDWWELGRRCIEGIAKYGAFERAELEQMFDFMFRLKAMGGGRHLWQLGTHCVDKVGADSLNNCWFVACNALRAFTFAMDQLMLGGGVGFSVQARNIYKLPPVRFRSTVECVDSFDCNFIVPDNREGWCELLDRVFDSFFHTGRPVRYNVKTIREKGMPIKTFGGTASGGQILVEGIGHISALLTRAVGRQLNTVECLDIFNIIADIVVAGNVRRSAEIAIGDCNDLRFLEAKKWEKGHVPSWRQRSNNTVESTDIRDLLPVFWENYNGAGEPTGLFNLDLCRSHGRLIDGPNYRPDPLVEGCNPCQPGFATVITPEGITTFDEIDVGSEIWTGERWTKVVRKLATGIKPVFEYRTTAGTFIGTTDHQVIEDGDRVRAEDASGIDIVVGPKIDDCGFDSQFIMDGLVLGDGTTHAASNNLILLCIGKDDADYFDSEVADHIGDHRPGIKEGAYEVETQLLRLPKTYERSIPDHIRFGNWQQTSSFLRGLFSANGSVVRGRVTLKAASFKVIQQAQEMLSSLGIRSYWTTNAAHEVMFDNGTYECRESYDLNITSDRDKFASRVGFIQRRKMQKLNEAVKSTQLTSKPKKVTFDVREVVPLGEMPVYDITVEDHEHVYWTGGLLVSNCGEIPLESFESCLLGELILPNLTVSDFHRSAGLMTKWLKTVSCIPHAQPETRAVVERNHRLGLGVTGYLQSEYVGDANTFGSVYRHVEQVDKEYSKLLGVTPSVKLTTVKPSGTLSLLPGCTAGVHPEFGRYFIRRVEFDSDDELVSVARDHGFWVEPKLNWDRSQDIRKMVVEFPCKAANDETVTADDLTAIEQMEHQEFLQTHWADNSVSCTVVYDVEELPAIRKRLEERYKENIKTCSFLLRGQEAGFPQMPFEAISEEEYLQMSAGTRQITGGIETSGEANFGECKGGSCPVK